MPKVSVIVPVYNVEQYLPQCLDSILAQTLEDIEIVCIDDGSTDGSGRILDEYAGKDSRVRVFHRTNAGYGAAMNVGLDEASGEYIGIVESDDSILPGMYAQLYSHAMQDGLDLVKSDAFYWIESAEYKRRIHYSWLDHYYDRVLGDEARNQFFDFFMNIWTGIYKRKFLEEYGIRFHESLGASYQDNGFWIQTLLYCRKAKWLNQAFYLYRQDNPAASVKSPGKIRAMAEEYEALAQTLKGRGDDAFLPYCYYFKMFRHRGTFLRIADECKRDFCRQIKKDYTIYKGYIKGNRCLEEWFYSVLSDPDKACERITQRKQEITEKLKSAKSIIIYGAGNRGNDVFRILYNEGYYGRLLCFAVSENPPDGLIAGRPILSIEEACSLSPGALVVIAVVYGSNMYRQMEEKLAKMGISNYMPGTSLEENFYIV